MAKTLALYDGGMPLFKFPGYDSTRDWGTPLPKQVAGEYNRGYFTLGNILQPAALPYQRDALAKARPTDIPVDVALVVIPELHSVNQIFVSVEPEAPAGPGCCGGANDTMEGVTFSVFAKLVNLSEAGDYDSVAEFIEASPDFELPDGFENLDANAEGYFHGSLATAESTATTTVTLTDAFDQVEVESAVTSVATTVAPENFVPKGYSLVFGVRLETAPTGTAGVFEAMSGRIALVAKVENFEFPIHK